MKKLIFILLLLPLCNLQAQSSLLSKDNSWKIVNFVNGFVGFSCIDTMTICIGETITKNDLQYTEILHGDSILSGYMRQDGQKYYFNPKDSEQEFLLYDFSVAIGDTVNIVCEEFWESASDVKAKCSYTVSKIDTFTDKQGNERKRITLNSREVWIEGIGSLQGLTRSCSNLDIGEGTQLISFSNNNDKIATFGCICSDLIIKSPLINENIKQEWTEVCYAVTAQGMICDDISTIFWGEKITKNEKEYTSVMQSKSDSEGSSLCGYMCQEGEKYYFSPINSEHEFLLYDFSLQKGDSVEIIDESAWKLEEEIRNELIADGGFKYYVKDVDTFTDKNGTERKRISFENGETWIEGIGCPNGLLHSFSQLDGRGTRLLSYSENGTQLYENSCPCEFQSAIVESENKISLSPNPVKNILSLTLQELQNTIQIFNLQGQMVLQEQVAQTAELNLSGLPAGMYVLVVNGKDSQRFVKE